MNISQIAQLMQEKGVAQPADLIGVGPGEISKLETHFSLKFPQAYREYLRAFGRSAGYLSPWLAIYFDDLKEIRDQFDLLLITHDQHISLPQDALLIGQWESVFDFLRCDGCADPTVYRLDLCDRRGQNKPAGNDPVWREYAPSFTRYLEKLARTTQSESLPEDLFGESELQENPDDLINY